MKGDYPRFKATYAHEELVEHFLLSPAEQALVNTCRGDANRHGVALLLKAVQYLGYFPDNLHQVPPVIRTFIAHQLQLLWDHIVDYPWHSRSRDNHLALIRQHTGWRFPTGQDKQELETWLRTQGAFEAPTEEDLREYAYARLRTLGIELPAEQGRGAVVEEDVGDVARGFELAGFGVVLVGKVREAACGRLMIFIVRVVDAVYLVRRHVPKIGDVRYGGKVFRVDAIGHCLDLWLEVDAAHGFEWHCST